MTEWNFPLMLVPKPDGTIRPVIGYRELNKKTIPDRLPLPVTSYVLRSLGTSNKLFNTIYIKSAFWQIELDEASRPLTAFSTPEGHYQFRIMPFGILHSPLTTSRTSRMQELTTLNPELIYSEHRKDDTWKQITEYLEDKTQNEAQKLPRKYKLSDFQLHNGLLCRNTEITCIRVSRGRVKQLVIPRVS